jgi:hypothetical protein
MKQVVLANLEIIKEMKSYDGQVSNASDATSISHRVVICGEAEPMGQ